METKASHLLVGIFTLVSVAAAFVLIVVIGKVQFDRAYAYYDIVFDDAVSGLSNAGDVRYNGILVGEVRRIWIKPETPDKVWVKVRIERRDDIVIREDSVASLEFQGVTGVSYVQISGGRNDSPVLPIVADETAQAPVIAAKPSALQAVFASVPSMLAEAEKLLIEARALFSDENKESLRAILSNVSTLTDAVAGEKDNIGTLIRNTAEISTELATASKQLTEMTGHINGLLDKDVSGFINQARETTAAYEVLADDVSRLIRKNEDGINTFTEQGLAQLAFFLTEARQLVASLDRIAQKLESDAPSFIFGTGRGQEIEAGRTK